ncbi:Crp/Fnr family transcriptional regulator [Cohnella sp. WQ 127256]|uniref:Crp/Fnr family transcriptional regulator n=1 Tax=Cohnella sp. WQ 127256 TaxID=2938790 RepID=UPI00211970CA|nr:Crp/Fnr family transcriptional regulator [Cohnella sp. WQ 127256]
MKLHKGQVLFHQGDTGPLYHLKSGLLKIIRLHEDGTPILVNIIVPGEIIPHHSLISPNINYGTAVALVTCDIEVLPSAEWYQSLDNNPDKCRSIALLLQEKLRMMQKRIDQLTEVTPAGKLQKLQAWFNSYITQKDITDVLTQDEIAQFIGLRRETVNRLLRSQTDLSADSVTASKLPAGPKNS